MWSSVCDTLGQCSARTHHSLAGLQSKCVACAGAQGRGAEETQGALPVARAPSGEFSPPSLRPCAACTVAAFDYLYQQAHYIRSAYTVWECLLLLYYAYTLPFTTGKLYSRAYTVLNTCLGALGQAQWRRGFGTSWEFCQRRPLPCLSRGTPRQGAWPLFRTDESGSKCALKSRYQSPHPCCPNQNAVTAGTVPVVTVRVVTAFLFFWCRRCGMISAFSAKLRE